LRINNYNNYTKYNCICICPLTIIWHPKHDPAAQKTGGINELDDYCVRKDNAVGFNIIKLEFLISIIDIDLSGESKNK